MSENSDLWERAREWLDEPPPDNGAPEIIDDVTVGLIRDLLAALAEMTEMTRVLGEAVLDDHSKDCKHCSLVTDNEANCNELRKRPTCCDCLACSTARTAIERE